MLSLLSRLFGLFSFKSRKSLFLFLGLLFTAVFLIPTFVSPVLRYVSMGPRLNLLVKMNALDKAKMKEPLLKKSYEYLLEDVSRRDGSPAPAKVGVSKAKKPGKITDYLKKENMGVFLCGFSFWALLGIISLFAAGAKVGIRIAVFFLLFAIGCFAGTAALILSTARIIPTAPLGILAVQMLAVSVIGTLSRELNAR